jgi:hypothetical protein
LLTSFLLVVVAAAEAWTLAAEEGLAGIFLLQMLTWLQVL